MRTTTTRTTFAKGIYLHVVTSNSRLRPYFSLMEESYSVLHIILQAQALEKTGLLVSKFKPHGILNFYFGLKAKPGWVVHIFSTKTFEGELKSNEEGILRWFAFDKIPYNKMWQDDEH